MWVSGEQEARHKSTSVDAAFTEEFWTLYQRFVLGIPNDSHKQSKSHTNNPKTKEEFTTKFNESSISFKFSKI